MSEGDKEKGTRKRGEHIGMGKRKRDSKRARTEKRRRGRGARKRGKQGV